jgi:hypothetical protein
LTTALNWLSIPVGPVLVVTGIVAGLSTAFACRFHSLALNTFFHDALLQVMGYALELHDNVLRSLLLQHGGHEVTTEGDSFTLVFHCPHDAVAWCLAVQQVGLQ